MGCIGLFDPQELCELRNALEEVSVKNEASCGQRGLKCMCRRMCQMHSERDKYQ